MKIQTSKTAIILLSEVIEELRGLIRQALIDCFNELFDNDDVSAFANNSGIFHKDPYGNYSQKSLEKIFTMWSEMCAENFFHEHPEFDDVLVEIDVPSQQCCQREWLAEREWKAPELVEKTSQSA